MLDAAPASGRVLRVMENYLFYEPLRKLKAVAESGEIGEVRAATGCAGCAPATARSPGAAKKPSTC
jgi:predicted dehydrogenase